MSARLFRAAMRRTQGEATSGALLSFRPASFDPAYRCAHTGYVPLPESQGGPVEKRGKLCHVRVSALHAQEISNVKQRAFPPARLRVPAAYPHEAFRFSPLLIATNARRLRGEGAGNAGCAMHPQPRVRNEKARKQSHHRFTERVRHSLRDGFTAYSVLSPVNGLFCHRHPQEAFASQELDASVAASGPHGFAVRKQTRSSLALASRPSLPRVLTFVTIAIRPSFRARDGGEREVFRHRAASGRGAASWHDGQIRCGTRNCVKCRAVAASFLFRGAFARPPPHQGVSARERLRGR